MTILYNNIAFLNKLIFLIIILNIIWFWLLIFDFYWNLSL